MSRSDKKLRRVAKRSAANGRKSRSANGNSDAFKIGLADFEKICAVEGLRLSAEMKKMFREFDRENCRPRRGGSGSSPDMASSP